MKLSNWYRKYRIVNDGYCGYEVQKWTIWCPFWTQLGWCNTHRSMADAEIYALRDAKLIVKYL